MVVAVCLALYGWTTDFPMVFDDYAYLITNPLLRDWHSFGYLAHFHEFATLPARMGLPTDLATNFILRPVAYATFYCNYLFDSFHPRWFRAVNIGVHAANAALIYALLRCLLVRCEGVARRSAAFIAGTAALLFAAHPLATESVTYIVQRFTTLSTFFYLLSLWLYFSSRPEEGREGKRWLRAAATMVLLLGMLTKECCFTAPLAALLLDVLVLRTPLKRALRAAVPLLLCLPLVPILVLMTSSAQNGGNVSVGEAMNVANLNAVPWTGWEYLVTQSTVVVSYLQRLVWPSSLNIDPEWPVYHSLAEWPVLRSLLVISALLGGAWAVYRRHGKDGRAACILAGVLWFFLSISISSGLVPLPDMMAEHRSYLPSVGIFLALACVLDCWRSGSSLLGSLGGAVSSERNTVTAGLKSKNIGAWLAPATALLAFCALGWTTCNRNQVWRSASSLWEDTAAKSPGNSRAWGNLGAAYTNDGRYEDAARCYEKAIALDSHYATAYLNLASVLNALHRSQQVLEVIDRLLKFDKNADQSPDVQANRSIALVETGRMEEGIRILSKVTKEHPGHRMSHLVLGMVYGQTGKPRKALEEYRHAGELQMDPGLASLIQGAEAALASQQQQQQAQPEITAKDQLARK